MNKTHVLKIAAVIGAVTLVANIIYLNFRLLGLDKKISETTGETAAGKVPEQDFPPVAVTPLPDGLRTGFDSEAVAQQIREATASLTKRVDELAAGKGRKVAASPTTQVKEYYIPLGSGSTTATDWTDVSGVEAYVAPSNYGTIHAMYFEAALRVPSGSGRIYARLKDVTGANPLFESEVSHEGTTGMLISSGSIPVPYVTKLYRVQLKSSLGAQVVLDNARIKLFTQ